MLSKTFEDSLLAGIKDINEREIASFHMPGHKKRIAFFGQERGRTCSAFEIDLTEIEGLDDLTYPAGAILNIEKKFAHVYRVSKSFLSLGGASHGLIAAILAVSKPGKSILIPRNAHRSIINAIVLSGAEVRWYEPEWETEWGFWGVAKASTIEDCLKNFDDIEAVVVVSPTFAGAVSDIASISPVLKEKKVKLIVDEAHGAHFVPGSTMPQSAASLGADLVVHSLHKTLPGLTQTGLIHVTETSLVASEAVKAALRLVTSSSPSYPLMVSMDQVARLLQEKQFILQVDQLKEFSEKALAELKKVDGFQAYDCDFKNDPLHMTLRIDGVKGSDLCKYFQSKGVFVESDLGSGCLLLAGLGNLEEDFRVVLKTARDNSFSLTGKVIQYPKPEEIVQKMNPKKAFFAASELIELNSLAGKIAAECYAPCPPGIPVLSPGALVPENINQFRSMIGKVRVVKE